jgi:hypothetical protein
LPNVPTDGQGFSSDMTSPTSQREGVQYPNESPLPRRRLELNSPRSIIIGCRDCSRKIMRSLAAPLITLMLSMGSAVAGPGMPADAINMAEIPKAAKGLQPGMVKAEVLLDRLHFSPGVIDGAGGDNFRKALAAFEVSQQLEGNGQLDQAAWAKLTDRSQDPVGSIHAHRR